MSASSAAEDGDDSRVHRVYAAGSAAPGDCAVAATYQVTAATVEYYVGWMLDLAAIDVEDVATALQDQTDYEHRWLIDPRTGEIVLWTSDSGIDGENPVELDELDLIAIDPVPSYIWYQDMVDFAEGISDEAVSRRLFRTLQGSRVFRRFKDELHQHDPELISAWYAFSDARALVRAVEWLAEAGLIDNDAAQRYKDDHPDPTLP